MPGIASVLIDNCQPLHTAFSSASSLAKDETGGSCVLSEIEVNTQSSVPSASHSLKRKRPLKIQIPSSAGALPALPNHEDEAGGYELAGCGVFCKRGKRKRIMEDTHKILSQLGGDSKKGFFGVYDGHGGRNAAEFVAANLHENILKMVADCGQIKGKEEAIKDGYLKTDQDFLKQGLCSGSCCITVLIEEGDIVVSNLGDCRAVLSRGGVAEALTVDHKVGLEDERNRIEEKGGYCDIHHGIWRVQGTLSVSRSIGDVDLKEWVIAEPETKTLQLTPDMEFLILASDGLWDKVGNQEAIDIAMRVHLDVEKKVSTCEWDCNNEYGCENIRPPSKARKTSSGLHRLRSARSSEDSCFERKFNPGRLLVACKELVSLATIRGSSDDITVLLIDLKRFLHN